MTDSSQPLNRISRRSFLKASGAAAGILGIAGASSVLSLAVEQGNANAQPSE